MRDHEYVNCEVAREALSARIDGEREPVPAARVDEHLAGCAECRAWHSQMSGQADMLRRLARQPPVAAVDDRPQRRQVGSVGALSGKRWALLAVGLTQCALGAAQAFGLGLGLQHGPDMGGGHLFNESTAWSLALGLVMVAAVIRPALAAGLAGVLSAFVIVLAAYVIADGLSAAVTPARVLSHLPVLLGAVLAALVWRDTAAAPPPPRQGEQDGDSTDITLPRHASRGRRRGHLWPTDDSAA